MMTSITHPFASPVSLREATRLPPVGRFMNGLLMRAVQAIGTTAARAAIWIVALAAVPFLLLFTFLIAARWLIWFAAGLLLTAAAAIATIAAIVVDGSRRAAVQARLAEAEARRRAETQQYLSDVALAGREWLVGDGPTIADIGCWGRMVFMAEGGLEIERWPNVHAWSRRLAAMPGFALPYDLIPKKDTEVVPA